MPTWEDMRYKIGNSCAVILTMAKPGRVSWMDAEHVEAQTTVCSRLDILTSYT